MDFEQRAAKQQEENRERLEPGMEYLRARFIERLRANQKLTKWELIQIIDTEIEAL